MEKTDIGTITRTILIVIALINQGLLIAGKNPLPFEDDQIAQVISFGFTAVTALIAWWKNNNFSQEAKEAQHYLDALKSVKKKPENGQVEMSYQAESNDDEIVMG
jgi:SPP1 family holin